MEIIIEKPEQAAVPIDRSAIALGLDKFSLFSRIQTGEIKAARTRSGEMVIPRGELERLAGGPITVHPAQEGTVLPDKTLGIQSWYGGLTRKERPTESRPLMVVWAKTRLLAIAPSPARLPGHWNPSRISTGERGGQLPESCDFEIKMSPTELREVRSALLNLNQGEILLCQRGNEFATIERFQEDSPYATANSDAQMLWKGNHVRALTDARLTLEFMASNLTAKAQKIVWEQYPDHRPGHIGAAITERCHLAIANEETISRNQRVGHRVGGGISI